MTRRTVLISAVGVVVVAAAVIALVVTTGASSADPHESTITDMCRDAAADEPGMVHGVKSFDVSELTHEVEDDATFYRATGTASTGDGYGGETTRTFDCTTKLVGDGTRWELIDIFVM